MLFLYVFTLCIASKCQMGYDSCHIHMYVYRKGYHQQCGKHIGGDRVDTYIAEKSSFSYFHALDVEYYVSLSHSIFSSYYYRHV